MAVEHEVSETFPFGSAVHVTFMAGLETDSPDSYLQVDEYAFTGEVTHRPATVPPDELGINVEPERPYPPTVPEHLRNRHPQWIKLEGANLSRVPGMIVVATVVHVEDKIRRPKGAL